MKTILKPKISLGIKRLISSLCRVD